MHGIYIRVLTCIVIGAVNVHRTDTGVINHK